MNSKSENFSNSLPKTQPAKKQANLLRNGIFQLDEVLPYIIFSGNRKKPKYSGQLIPEIQRTYNGVIVWMTSLRYQVFALKGTKCVTCGLEGKYFALEQHINVQDNLYHFNLYGIDAVGDEVLITKDHIIPKSKGGRDHLDNLQPMCAVCNTLKGCELEKPT